MEYDLMLRALAVRDVPAVDLRPVLINADAAAPVYRRTDTHWNNRGALLAYNAVVAGLGRPDWAIDPPRVLRGTMSTPGGDLARMLGVEADVIETSILEGSDQGSDAKMFATEDLGRIASNIS